MLNSFEITGFRTFSHLRVERLGRVNLIVGRNNVGKTMFLEALRLYALGGSPAALKALLLERDEIEPELLLPPDSDEAEAQLRIASLFNRNVELNRNKLSIQIGPVGDASQVLKISPLLLIRRHHSPGPGYSLEPFSGTEPPMQDGMLVSGLEIAKNKVQLVVHVQVQHPRTISTSRMEIPEWPPYVPARGVPDRDVARWWDSISLKIAESRVIESLGIISSVERISLIENPAKRGERIVMAKMKGDDIPMPLKSFGDGMLRIFQIALAIECARFKQSASSLLFDLHDFFNRNGANKSERPAMLLVDEIENGIHYRVLPDFWRFILEVAKLHDVQVFATSHSWDCIQALQEAAAGTPDADVMLIRLERKPDSTKAVLFDRDELAIVTRDNIEVR